MSRVVEEQTRLGPLALEPQDGRRSDGQAPLASPRSEAAEGDPAAQWRSERIRFGGIEFDNVTMDEAVAGVEALVHRGGPAMVVTPNVDHVMRLQSDLEFAKMVQRADLVLADGQPIVWATRLLGKPLKERVAGSDLVGRLCEYAARTGLRVFFLGGNPGAAAMAERELCRRFPTLRSVGNLCPDFGFEQDPEKNREVVEAVRKARPDILFVGLGSPKQERWIHEHRHAYQVPVSLGIGVSFSFIAGEIKRAPRWMQRWGLEWLHRLCSEPRRLWRRYLVRGPRFLSVIAREIVMAQPVPARENEAASPQLASSDACRGSLRLPLMLEAVKARGASS